MNRLICAWPGALLVLLIGLTVGCGQTPSMAPPAAGPPVSSANYPHAILGMWRAGMNGTNWIIYVFHGDKTVTENTSKGKGQVTATGTYTIKGNKLTIHLASPQAREETHTISMAGKQLTFQDMGLSLGRIVIPPWHPLPHIYRNPKGGFILLGLV